MREFYEGELERIAVVGSPGGEVTIYKQWRLSDISHERTGFVGFVLGRYPYGDEVKDQAVAAKPILIPISREMVDRLTGLLQSELMGQERDERQKYELLRIAKHHSEQR